MENLKSVTIFILILIFSSFSLIGQCENLSVEVNKSSFEEVSLSFINGAEETIKVLDLAKLNPYNKFSFNDYIVDSDYGMKSYRLSSEEAHRYTKDILGTPDTTLITAVNSQVDVVKEKDCSATISFGLYRMNDEGQYLSVAGVVMFYDQQGELIGSLESEYSQIQYPLLIEEGEKSYVAYVTRSAKNKVTYHFYDMTCQEQIYSCEDCSTRFSMSARADSGNSKKLYFNIFGEGQKIYDRDRKYVILDPEDRVIFSVNVAASDTRRLVRLGNDGLMWRNGKGGVYIEPYEEVKSYKILKKL